MPFHPTARRSWSRILAGTFAFTLCMSLASFGLTPAWAQRPWDTKDAIALVGKIDPSRPSATRSSVTKGNRVELKRVTLEIDSRGSLESTPSSRVFVAPNVHFVIRDFSDGVQIAAVLRDQASSRTQSYSFPGQFLELLDDGSVVVRKAGQFSEPVAIIDKPWARDSKGTPVATSYHVAGSRLTQTVEPTETTSFPVVADPRVRSAWYGWSVDFTRGETSTMALGAGSCAIVAAAIPLAAVRVAVSLACGGLALMANTATSYNKCISLKVISATGMTVVPWITTCYR